MLNNQLTLSVHLTENATFDNYYTFENRELIHRLKSLDRNQEFIYIWGESGLGRSHLLKASCQWAMQHQFTCIYIPLKNINEISPSIFENIEKFFLICIDDIDLIAGIREWEEAIFHFYNKAKNDKARLVITSAYPANKLQLLLPDLSSRLTNGITYSLKPLSDSQKLKILQINAKNRGFTLSDEVGYYILHHFPRNMRILLDVLEKLDKASLEAQHKITIPFVKSVLETTPK